MARGLWSCHSDSRGTVEPVGGTMPSSTGEAPADFWRRNLASGVSHFFGEKQQAGLMCRQRPRLGLPLDHGSERFLHCILCSSKQDEHDCLQGIGLEGIGVLEFGGTLQGPSPRMAFSFSAENPFSFFSLQCPHGQDCAPCSYQPRGPDRGRTARALAPAQGPPEQQAGSSSNSDQLQVGDTCKIVFKAFCCCKGSLNPFSPRLLQMWSTLAICELHPSIPPAR